MQELFLGERLEEKVSVLERCPHFRGVLSEVSLVRCPHFRGVLSEVSSFQGCP